MPAEAVVIDWFQEMMSRYRREGGVDGLTKAILLRINYEHGPGYNAFTLGKDINNRCPTCGEKFVTVLDENGEPTDLQAQACWCEV